MTKIIFSTLLSVCIGCSKSDGNSNSTVSGRSSDISNLFGDLLLADSCEKIKNTYVVGKNDGDDFSFDLLDCKVAPVIGVGSCASISASIYNTNDPTKKQRNLTFTGCDIQGLDFATLYTALQANDYIHFGRDTILSGLTTGDLAENPFTKEKKLLNFADLTISNSKISNVDFKSFVVSSNLIFRDSSIENSAFEVGRISSIENTAFSASNLSTLGLEFASINNSSFDHCISDAPVHNLPVFHFIRNSVIKDSDFSDANLSIITMENNTWENVDLSGSNFYISNVSDSKFMNVDFDNALLLDSIFTNNTFINSPLDGARFPPAEIMAIIHGNGE